MPSGIVMRPGLEITAKELVVMNIVLIFFIQINNVQGFLKEFGGHCRSFGLFCEVDGPLKYTFHPSQLS